jgi:hypothetical protein
MKFVLLTATKNMLMIANDSTRKDRNDISLAWELSSITNKFWFKLNRGLGNNSLPKSFDIVTKAQICIISE